MIVNRSLRPKGTDPAGGKHNKMKNKNHEERSEDAERKRLQKEKDPTHPGGQEVDEGEEGIRRQAALLPSTWPGQGDTGVILERSREELRGSSSLPVRWQKAGGGEGRLNPFHVKQ